MEEWAELSDCFGQIHLTDDLDPMIWRLENKKIYLLIG